MFMWMFVNNFHFYHHTVFSLEELLREEREDKNVIWGYFNGVQTFKYTLFNAYSTLDLPQNDVNQRQHKIATTTTSETYIYNMIIVFLPIL